MRPLVKLWIVLALLFSSVVISYSMPRAKYVGTNIISKMEIPQIVNEWRGKDVTDQLNLDIVTDTNKFISEAKVMQYINKKGDTLHFIILDAGNFHHPNVCFTASGYEIKELEDIKFNLSGRIIQAHTLYTEKNQVSAVSLYWIIIDKKITHNWIEQKIKQFYFSLFNRERIGLMVRFDIATGSDNIDNAIEKTKQFIQNLNESLLPESAEYLFGEST